MRSLVPFETGFIVADHFVQTRNSWPRLRRRSVVKIEHRDRADEGFGHLHYCWRFLGNEVLHAEFASLGRQSRRQCGAAIQE